MHVGDEGQRLTRGQTIEQREILGDDADAPLHRDGFGQGIEAENPHRTGRWFQQAGQALDGGRLAGAVRSQESIEAARGNREVDAVDGTELTEIAREPMRLDGQFHAVAHDSSAAITAAVNCGTSSGLRDVIRLPSLATGRST